LTIAAEHIVSGHPTPCFLLNEGNFSAIHIIYVKFVQLLGIVALFQNVSYLSKKNLKYQK
jgi:hypothetical protein